MAKSRLKGPQIQVRRHPYGLDGQPVGLFPKRQGPHCGHGSEENGVYVPVGQPLGPGQSHGVENGQAP